LLKYEPKFRLRRKEVIPKKATNRKAWKELKTKIRKSRGKERSKLYATRKTDKVEEIRKLKSDYLKTFVAK
jgi:small subunit ribosomal protein S24e